MSVGNSLRERRELEMEAEILLTYKGRREAEAVARAVSPDNVKVPRGLSIETRASDKKVFTTISYSGDKIGTFISTIDDLLSCVTVAERAFSAIKRKR